MQSDGALLREYSRCGSESSFAELVRRHLDFVYSTALRGLGGDEHLAKDVTQSVFMDLARKAGQLEARSILTGWLYTSTCFAATKAVRSEQRRKAREQEAHRMREVLKEQPQDSEWDQIGPVLNAAMLELRDSDREALLLRFFERHSLAGVAEKLGLTENAARMRVERAVERLRKRLLRHDVTTSVAGLGIALAEQAVISAPAGLAASITAASLSYASASGGLTILTLALMSKQRLS